MTRPRPEDRPAPLTATQIEHIIYEVLGPSVDRALVEAMVPRLLAIAVAGADYIAYILGAARLIGPGDAAIARILEARRALLAGINGTTRYRLRAALLRNINAGATARELQQAVMDVFGTAEGFRSESIALTEGGLYWETGAWREMSDLGGLVRDWITMRDEFVRDSHAEMDGQCRPPEVAFTSGNGIPLLYPRDPSGPIEEIANCRCFAAPIAGRCDGRGLRLRSEAARLAYWKSADRAMRSAVRPVREVLRATFRGQRIRFLERLDSALGL